MLSYLQFLLLHSLSLFLSIDLHNIDFPSGSEMEVESCVPPGFRFHPTEEELVGYYLARKIASQKTDLEVITDIDLYRIEPWDLQDRCSLGYEEQSEWFFFSHKDKKYPTGTRTNRATTAGFWKATGRDKAVVSNSRLIGMRKTLVFYIGRAPNGRKTDWIIHEYRLQSSEHEPPQEEGWVVCRAFKKQIPNQRQGFNNFSPNYRSCRDHDQFGSETPFMGPFFGRNLHGIPFGGGGNQLESRHSPSLVPDILQLDSPNLSANLPTKECFDHNIATNKDCISQKEETMGQFIDWKDLDKLLASQSSESTSYFSSNLPIVSLDCGADDPNHDQFLASFDT